MIDCSLPLQYLSKLLIPLGVLRAATDYTNVFYHNEDGKTLHAYLALPTDYDANKTYPAAMVFHAWNGMSQEPVYFADLLAEEGYIALAPDLFRNVATCETNIPWNVVNTIVTPQDRMDEDIDMALEYLSTLNVDTSVTFSGPGFCFGGSQALNLGVRRPMAGTISLYGASTTAALQNPDDDSAWGNLGAGGTQVLGIYGEEDGRPSPEEALGFASAMNARGIINTVTIYEDVGHAFVNPEDHSRGMMQARDAWDQVVDFLSDQSRRRHKSRELDLLNSAPLKSSVGRSSWAWLWDHTMDFFYGKGHFAHGSGRAHLFKHRHVHRQSDTNHGNLRTIEEKAKGALVGRTQITASYDDLEAINATVKVGRAA